MTWAGSHIFDATHFGPHVPIPDYLHIVKRL